MMFNAACRLSSALALGSSGGYANAVNGSKERNYVGGKQERICTMGDYDAVIAAVGKSTIYCIGQLCYMMTVTVFAEYCIGGYCIKRKVNTVHRLIVVYKHVGDARISGNDIAFCAASDSTTCEDK